MYHRNWNNKLLLFCTTVACKMPLCWFGEYYSFISGAVRITWQHFTKLFISGNFYCLLYFIAHFVFYFVFWQTKWYRTGTYWVLAVARNKWSLRLTHFGDVIINTHLVADLAVSSRRPWHLQTPPRFYLTIDVEHICGSNTPLRHGICLKIHNQRMTDSLLLSLYSYHRQNLTNTLRSRFIDVYLHTCTVTSCL
jgi:hypothetical protein